MTEKIYIINGVEYELYTANDDYCVTVKRCDGDTDYSCGNRENALEFILNLANEIG